MQDEIQNETTEVRTEPLIGEFKPKRKFLNFVSAVNGARIRFIRDVAFLKGENLSGILEGAIFKITICDEGTINIEEQEGTNLSDKSMIQRLLNEIDEMETTGYAQKFVLGNLEFADIKGDRCYLEVEHQKPIDKLKSLFDEDEKAEVSDKGLSILDQLFSDEEDEEEFDEDHTLSEVMNSMLEDLSEEDVKTIIESTESPVEPNESLKVAAESYMEQQFRKMNEAKIVELEYRIEETQREIIRYRNDAKQSESKAEEKSESLGILETRLETMKPVDEPNGYVFFVSEEIKDMEGLDETEAKVAAKIADIMKLKTDVLIKMLTDGYYKIKIAKKNNITAEKVEIDKEILDKMSFDPMGKMSMVMAGEFQYRGKLNWHQLVSKMMRNGFEQEPEFDKLCQSNSYDSHEEEQTVQEYEQQGLEKYSYESEPKQETLVDVDLVEIKSKSVRTFDEETTLVVMGTIDHNDNRDVEITDDYTSFGVYVGDKRIMIGRENLHGFYESDGFISIMTLPEFKIWQTQYPDAMEDGGGIDSFLLPNFKGTIGVTAVDEDSEFTTDFDLSDYIQHQLEDAEVFLTLPEGTEVMKMDDFHQVPLSLLRDIKINKIIK